MTKFKKQVAAAFSAGSMFLSMVTPALASTTIEITGNGANSDNSVEVKNKNTTTVVQTNSAVVTNTVNTSANTGGNDANQNTGGSVLVSTGNAKTKTDISNLLNSNRAGVDCCNSQDVDVLISGNGAYSDNEVKIHTGGQKKSSFDIYVNQINDANVTNDVESQARTGKNDANQNTGGDVLIHTGNAMSLVDVSTTANSNWARVGGSDRQGSLSARILDNGADSDNEIKLKLNTGITLVQTNHAKVKNAVDARASTGKNDANQNTGGDVLIATGDALTDVEIDNMVNFNWADVDCGCLTDLLAKISGNGYRSDNEIKFRLDDDLYVPQTNVAGLSNLLDGYARTGKNDVNQNTGTPDGDPGILTGNAWSYTNVSNTANLNSYGAEGASLEMPDFEFEFSFSLNWRDFLRLLRWM